MKIQFKNLIGSLVYSPELQIYVAEFVIADRYFLFSGENKIELYRHMSASLEPYAEKSDMKVNMD